MLAPGLGRMRRGATGNSSPISAPLGSTHIPFRPNWRGGPVPTTPWLQWMLAIAMILTALYHIGHFVAAPPRVRRSKLDVDLTHAAMGTVMAIMLVGSLPSHTSRNLAIAFAFPACLLYTSDAADDLL